MTNPLTVGRALYIGISLCFVFIGTVHEEKDMLKCYPAYGNFLSKYPFRFLPNLSVLFMPKE